MDTIPYDKRSGKIWFNNELVEWKDSEFMMVKFSNWKNILIDCFTQQKEWVSKCLTQKRK